MGQHVKQMQNLTLPLDAGNASKCFLGSVLAETVLEQPLFQMNG